MDMAADLAGGDASTAADLDWLTNVDLPTGIAPEDVQDALVLVPGCSPCETKQTLAGCGIRISCRSCTPARPTYADSRHGGGP
jgi:hypothetical protein